MLRPFKAAVLSAGIAAAAMGLSCQYVLAGFVPPALVTDSASNSANTSSWLGGVQFGYNRQQGSVVYGFETDISATHLKTDMNTLLPLAPPSSANTNADIDWFGTVRGRFGWASGPVLFYGTGGLAYGHVELNSSIASPVGPRFLGSQTSAVKAGWVAGGGIDYMWRPNVILNFGYQYVDLGAVSVAGTSTAFTGLLTQNATAQAHFSVVTVGLSWRFAATDAGPQGSWEGLYAGGHLGGAWGNRTTANYFDQPPVPSDARLKRDITLVARLDDGLGLYRYRYLWSDTVYVGVMAQEVALIHPDAVVRDALDDYLRVDYSHLGLKLMTESEWNARRKGERL